MPRSPRARASSWRASEAARTVLGEDGDAADVRVAALGWLPMAEEQARGGCRVSVDSEQHLDDVVAFTGAVVEVVDFFLDGDVLLLHEDAEADAEGVLHRLRGADD